MEEVSDFASKVEKAYKDGQNRPGFDKAVNYIRDVVKKAELEERQIVTPKSINRSEQSKENKSLRNDDDYEK